MRTGLKIPHAICFLLLLGSGEFEVQGLTVTGKDVPTEALRGKDVTIPCMLSGVPTPLNLEEVSVVWRQILQDKSEHVVYRFQGSHHHQSWRPGSHINYRNLQQGNASLYIPNIQITDEGNYRCFVTVAPDFGSATSTLHVSAEPQATLSYDRSIDYGITGSFICEVANFYPEDVKIRWFKYSKSTDTSLSLDRYFTLTMPLRNSDGTFNVTSVLTVGPSIGAQPEDILSCTVSHRSLEEEITQSFTMPRPSPLLEVCFFGLYLHLLLLTQMLAYFKNEWRPWINVFCSVILIIIILLLCVILYLLLDFHGVEQWACILSACMIVDIILLLLYGICIWRDFTKGEPSLSEISGDLCVPHGKRTTLTFQITNFRQKEIQINLYLKRRNEIKKRLMASWEPADRTSFKSSSNDLEKLIAGGQRANDPDVLPLLEGGGRDTLLPVEMEAEIREAWIGTYKCHGSITITPSADKDDGAMVGVEVEHVTLKWPISTFIILSVHKGDGPGLWRRWRRWNMQAYEKFSKMYSA